MDSNSEKNEGDSLFASSLAIPTNEINFLGKKTNSHVFLLLILIIFLIFQILMKQLKLILLIIKLKFKIIFVLFVIKIIAQNINLENIYKKSI